MTMNGINNTTLNYFIIQKVFYLLFSSLYKTRVMRRNGNMIHILETNSGSDQGGPATLRELVSRRVWQSPEEGGGKK